MAALLCEMSVRCEVKIESLHGSEDPTPGDPPSSPTNPDPAGPAAPNLGPCHRKYLTPAALENAKDAEFMGIRTKHSLSTFIRQ